MFVTIGKGVWRTPHPALGTLDIANDQMQVT